MRAKLIEVTWNAAHRLRSLEERKHQLFALHGPYVLTINLFSDFNNVTSFAIVHRVQVETRLRRRFKVVQLDETDDPMSSTYTSTPLLRHCGHLEQVLNLHL